jgi:hypothetical protein
LTTNKPLALCSFDDLFLTRDCGAMLWCRHQGKQTASAKHTRECIAAGEAQDLGVENKLMFAELKRLVYLCPK